MVGRRYFWEDLCRRLAAQDPTIRATLRADHYQRFETGNGRVYVDAYTNLKTKCMGVALKVDDGPGDTVLRESIDDAIFQELGRELAWTADGGEGRPYHYCGPETGWDPDARKDLALDWLTQQVLRLMKVARRALEE